MRYVNNGNLPDLMAKAVVKDFHDMEDAKYSVTQLCKPPRILQLERRHRDELVLEASDFFNAFIGSAIHGGIYNGLKDNEDFILEKRLLTEIAGIKIAGTPDCYQKSTKTLFDHKTMTTVAFAYSSEVKPEYEQQLNVYAHLLRANGCEVDAIKLNVIYLDWRKAGAKFADPTKYPMVPCRLVDVPIWTDAQAREFIETRIAMHEAEENVEDHCLAECAPSETWEKKGKIAIYPKGGAVKAMRLLDTEQEVTDYLVWKKLSRSAVQIVNRPCSRQRCESYCNAAPFCNQFKAWQESQKLT